MIEQKEINEEVKEQAVSEEKVEEPKVEEEKDLEAVEEQKAVEVENEELKSLNALIEEKRDPLMKLVNKNRKISNIITFFALPMVIASTFFIFTEYNWIGWILIGVALVAMLANYFVTKKQMDGKYKEFIFFIENLLITEQFKDSKYSDIERLETSLKVSDFENNGAYRNIVRVATRDNYLGKWENLKFKYSETALFAETIKRGASASCFCGKILDIENNLQFAGNFIINIVKEEPIDALNDVCERTKLYEKDNLTIYGDEGADFRAILGEQFVGNLKKIALNTHLLAVAIAVSAGHTLVFLSYDEDVMILPGERKLNIEAFDSSIKDIDASFNVVKLLGK